MVEHIATLLPHGTGDLRSAVLLLSSDTAFASHDDVLLVNGLPPLTVTELADRAEISLGTESLFYRKAGSTALEIFDSIEDEDCVRCKRRIAQGAVIRRCSVCGSAHHEGATTDPKLGDLWCAGYDPKCGRCGGLWDTTPASEDAHHGG